jgi:hypothetical protein
MCCEDVMEDDMRPIRYWPARASSAIPPRPPAEVSIADPVIAAGRLWQKHLDWCRRCDPAEPFCELGRTQYAVYVTAVEQERSKP